MDRPIQPVLMVAGCAVLLVAAIALPVAILRPAGQVELVSVRQTPIAEIPVRPPPAEKAPVVEAPVVQAPLAQAPVTKAPVAQAPAAKPPAARSRKPKAPPPAEIVEGDGLSRGQRFRIVQRETLKELGPEAALSSALARAFVFPTMRSDAVFGIDVSHYTTDNCGCQIDWDRVANQKVAFVYAKATEGVSYKDSTFDKHWSELGKRPKLHRGAYHFLRADADIEAQVKKFLDKMGPLQPGDLPPAMDLEWDVYRDSTRTWHPRDGSDYWSNLEPDEILARALKWLQLVERETGRVPVIYTSRAWWMQRIKDESKLELLKRYPIWISAMEDTDLRLEKPGAKGRWAGKWNWTLWQFTNMGDLTTGGIPNPRNPTDERMDVSIFPGDLGQFQQAVGISATIVVADNKVPAPQNTNAGGGATPAEPQKEPPKDTQVAENPTSGSDATKPTESNVSGTPATGGSTVTPAEPQKDPPKENQVAENPPTGGSTVKPDDSNATNVFASPATGGSVVAPVEPQKDPPKEDQAAVVPEAGGNTSKPAEPQKDPPNENQVADAPVSGDNIAKPSESNKSDVVANPATGNGTAIPAEPQKEPPKETQIASLPEADKPVASSPGTGAPNDARVPNNPPSPGGSDSGNDAGKKPSLLDELSAKSTIEIVLKNGRVLRVEENIDPAVLSRLITLIEK